MLYFTSDLHFYHDNIIQLTSRPYQDVNEMNERLIANWNKKIRPKDEVYILGDVKLCLCAGGAETAAWEKISDSGKS